MVYLRSGYRIEGVWRTFDVLVGAVEERFSKGR